MTAASDDDLAAVGDAELVARYEAIRVPRTPASDRLLREIGRRCVRAQSIRDPEAGIGYRWDDESESVVRENRSPVFVAARDAEIRRRQRIGLSLGQMALAAPGREFQSRHPSHVHDDDQGRRPG